MKVISSSQLKAYKSHSLTVTAGQVVSKGSLNGKLVSFRMPIDTAMKSIAGYGLEQMLNAHFDEVMTKCGHPEYTSRKDPKRNWGKLVIAATRSWLNHTDYRRLGNPQEDWEMDVIDVALTKCNYQTILNWFKRGMTIDHIQASILDFMKKGMLDKSRARHTARRDIDKIGPSLDKKSGDGRQDSSYMDYLQYLSEDEPTITNQQAHIVEKDFFDKLKMYVKQHARTPVVYKVFELSIPPHELTPTQIVEVLRRQNIDITNATVGNYMKEIRDIVYNWAKRNNDKTLVNQINNLFRLNSNMFTK